LISDSKQDFYIMRILDNGMIIMIPLDNVDSVGLRQVIDADQVPHIFAILKEREIVPDNQTWNRRYREYMDKIKTGSVFELAEVLRDLFILREDKELSFGERKMLDTARSLLVKEMSIAQDLDESQVEKDIHGIFGHEP
jgi:CarD family transcriptional regulator